jgi:arsenate reductase
LPTVGLRSKSWDEFGLPGAPHFDFIFTVCDDAAGEVCPGLPGHPMTAHWGIADPAAATCDEAQRLTAFRHAFLELDNRSGLYQPAAWEAARSNEARNSPDEIGSQRTAAVTA